MKTNKKTNGDRVVIYALYNDMENYYNGNDNSEFLSIDCDKEEELKKYCEEKQYEIEEIVRNSKSDYLPYKLKRLIEIIYKYPTTHCPGSYYSRLDKIIIYDIFELCSNVNEFNAIFDMTSREHIEIETIKQGKIYRNSFENMEVLESEN